MTRHIFKSVSVKMLLIMLLFVLPFNFLAILLNGASINLTKEQARLSVQNIMESQIIQLSNRVETAELFLYKLCFKEEAGKAYLNYQGGEEYEYIKSRFYSAASKSGSLWDGADGYFVYIENRSDILVWNPLRSNMKGQDVRDFLRQRMQEDVSIGWEIENINGSIVMCFYSDYYNNGNIYGGWINLETIFKELKGMILYQSVSFSVTGQQNVSEVEDYVQISIPISKGFWMNAVIREEEILGNIQDIYYILQRCVRASLLLIPVLYVIVNHLLLSPLKVLVEAQNHVQNGELDYRITKHAKSVEFEYAYGSFNQMAEQIRDLKLDNYEKEMDYQEMELRNLQLQIRPHFLLNTFSLIYTLTERRENEAIKDIVLYLSDYFRNLFRRESNLELFGKEKKLIEGYMKMVEVRYPGCVTIEYEYDSLISLVRIPPLLIHNFVENIIKHVVQQGILIHIKIMGRYRDGNVTFEIIDDGFGMPPEKIQELNESMQKKDMDSVHVGYVNSMRRLKYFYGESADIRICSEVGEGTRVIIRFPYDLSEGGKEV